MIIEIPGEQQHRPDSQDRYYSRYYARWNLKDKGGSQLDNDSSPNLSFNVLKQREMEKEEGSAQHVSHGMRRSF